MSRERLKKRQRHELYKTAGRFAKENLRKDCHSTEAVLRLSALLKTAGLSYRREHPVVNTSNQSKGKARRALNGQRIFIIDFYLPQLHVLIEVDGGYHSTPEQRAKDIARDRYLLCRGYSKVVRFTNEAVLSEDFDLIPSLLAQLPSKKRALLRKCIQALA